MLRRRVLSTRAHALASTGDIAITSNQCILCCCIALQQPHLPGGDARLVRDVPDGKVNLAGGLGHRRGRQADGRAGRVQAVARHRGENGRSRALGVVLAKRRDRNFILICGTYENSHSSSALYAWEARGSMQFMSRLRGACRHSRHAGKPCTQQNTHSGQARAQTSRPRCRGRPPARSAMRGGQPCRRS